MRLKNFTQLFRTTSIWLTGSIVFCFSILDSEAQQDPYFTHYSFVRQVYNPAVVGLGGKWCAFGLTHTQYTGMSDRTPTYTTPANPTAGAPIPGVGPKTHLFGLSVPLSKMDKSTKTVKNFGGIGATFYNDRLGYELSNNIRIQGAYRHHFSDDANLSVGVDLGYHQKGLDGAKLRALDPNDPYIPNSEVTDGKMTFSGGLFYNNERLNNLIIGLSSTHLAPQQYDYMAGAGTIRTETARHYYLLAGMDFENFMGNPAFTLMPTVLGKYNSKFQLDGTVMLEYMQTVGGGLGYRSISDALSVLLSYTYKGIRLGYSYDITMSQLNRVSNGSHEIFLRYCWVITPKVQPPPVHIITPRWMSRDPNAE